MTYRQLYENAKNKLDHGMITVGEYEKMIEPLDKEIEPESHWIPCKERMPETDGKYMVSVNLDGHEYCDEDYWYRDSWNMYYKRSITAWMPKIEPYREGDGFCSEAERKCK